MNDPQPWLAECSNNIEDLSFELTSLSKTIKYQQWLLQTVAPFLGNRILEIGSGIGNMSQWLPIREHLCLSEYDEGLFKILSERLNDEQKANPNLSLNHMNILDAKSIEEVSDLNVDSIVSFNVLEHIEDHQSAVANQISILKNSRAPGPKRLFILVPAHQWAHGTFDVNFEHHRRYSLTQLKTLIFNACPKATIQGDYMNTVGLAGWFLLGKILKRPEIGVNSINSFEKLYPIIRIVDKFARALRLPLGQSVWVAAEIK